MSFSKVSFDSARHGDATVTANTVTKMFGIKPVNTGRRMSKSNDKIRADPGMSFPPWWSPRPVPMRKTGGLPAKGDLP